MIKKAILMLGVASMFFVSAGLGSWLLLMPESGKDESEKNSVAAETVKSETKQLDVDTSDELVLPESAGSATPEEVFRMAVLLREQQQNFRREQESAKKEQVRMNLIVDDIKSQQRELDGVLAQLQDKIVAGESLMSRLSDERKLLEEERKAAQQELDTLKEAQSDSNVAEEKIVKQMSRWFQSMDPAQSADALRTMANDGQLNRVVRIMQNLEDRNAAKILGSMNDPVLVGQVMDEMQKGASPQDKTKLR